MATLLLTTIFAGSGAGALFAATLVGSIIDAELFGPDLPPSNLTPSANSGEGRPLPFPLGREAVCDGQAIWVSELTVVEGEAGGLFKEGTLPAQYVDVAYMFGSEVTVEDISEIWIRGKRIYQAAGTVTLANTDLSVNRIETVLDGTSGGWGIGAYAIVIQAPAGGTDLTQLNSSGGGVTVSGFSNSANNTSTGNGGDPFIIIRTSLLNDGKTEAWLMYTDTNGPGVVEAAGASVTIQQTNPNFSLTDAQNVTIHKGSASESPDALIVAALGGDISNFPAFRGRPYAVFRQLDVTNFGGSIPTQVRAILKVSSTATVDEAVETWMVRSQGIDASRVDVSEVAALNIPLRGCVVYGPASPQSIVNMLRFAFQLDVQERQGVYRFFPTTGADKVTITEGDLGATGFGSQDIVENFETDDPGETRAPQAFYVDYIGDPNNSYQPGSQIYRRNTSAVDASRGVRLPLVLTGNEAMALAKFGLRQLLIRSREFSWSLPPSYLRLIEGDIALLPQEGDTREVRVTRADRGIGGFFKYEGHLEDIDVATQTGFVEDQSSTKPGVNDIGSPGQGIACGIWDLNPYDEGVSITTDHLGPDVYEDRTGQFYRYPLILAAASYSGPTLKAGWAKAPVTADLADSNWAFYDQGTAGAPLGRALTVLGDIGDVQYLDMENTVKIQFWNQDTIPVSLPDTEAGLQDLVNGANRIIVGREVIHFMTATVDANDSSVFTLSGLLRGLRGTQGTTAGHVVGEPVLLLTNELKQKNAAVKLSAGYFHIFPNGKDDNPLAADQSQGNSILNIGDVNFFRAFVNEEGTLQDAVGSPSYFVQQSEVEGNYYKPPAPGPVRVVRTGTNTVNIYIWRGGHARRDSLDESPTIYDSLSGLGNGMQFEIVSSIGGSVVTIDYDTDLAPGDAFEPSGASGAGPYYYQWTSAPSSSFTITVYQLGNVAGVGRGYASDVVTVPAA